MESEAIVESTLASYKGKKHSEETRDLVRHMAEVCGLERVSEALVKPLDDVIGRTAIYVGVSRDTVESIDKGTWKCEEVKRNEAKKRKMSSYKIVLEDQDAMTLRNLVCNFYITHGRAPSIRELLPSVMKRMQVFENDVRILQQVLHDIGFNSRKINSKRRLLVENSSLTSARDEYLAAIRQLRGNPKIFYIYECIIDKLLIMHKIGKHNNRILDDEQTHILFCAASANGFLKNALMLHSIDTNEDLFKKSETFSKVFMKWLEQNLIPNLPEESVIVLDSAPYHWVSVDKRLSYYASKSEIVNYLSQRGVRCSTKMRRNDLYQLIIENTSENKTYIIEDTLNRFGHGVLRVPLFMTNLSPIHCIMKEVQDKIHCTIQANAAHNMYPEKVIEMSMSLISKDEWQEHFNKVRSLEDELWEIDSKFELVMDNIVQNLSNEDESESEGSDTDSVNEYHSDSDEF